MLRMMTEISVGIADCKFMEFYASSKILCGKIVDILTFFLCQVCQVCDSNSVILISILIL